MLCNKHYFKTDSIVIWHILCTEKYHPPMIILEPNFIAKAFKYESLNFLPYGFHIYIRVHTKTGYPFSIVHYVAFH